MCLHMLCIFPIKNSVFPVSFAVTSRYLNSVIRNNLKVSSNIPSNTYNYMQLKSHQTLISMKLRKYKAFLIYCGV